MIAILASRSLAAEGFICPVNELKRIIRKNMAEQRTAMMVAESGNVRPTERNTNTSGVVSSMGQALALAEAA